MIRVLTIAIAFLFFAPTSQAIEDSGASNPLDYHPATTPAPPDLSSLIVKMFAITAVMIVVCGGIVWVMKRKEKRMLGGVGSNGYLILEGSLQLDRRSSLHVVRADGHSLAVTTDATGLRSIVLLSDSFENLLQDDAAFVSK